MGAPHEFPRLLEEVNRLLIRRYALNDAIRITDLALHYFAAGTGTLPRHLSGSESNLSAKMASDILALFVKSNSLDIGFSRAIINLLATTPEVVSEQSDDQGQEVSGKGGQFSLLAPPLRREIKHALSVNAGEQSFLGTVE